MYPLTMLALVPAVTMQHCEFQMCCAPHPHVVVLLIDARLEWKPNRLGVPL